MFDVRKNFFEILRSPGCKSVLQGASPEKVKKEKLINVEPGNNFIIR